MPAVSSACYSQCYSQWRSGLLLTVVSPQLPLQLPAGELLKPVLLLLLLLDVLRLNSPDSPALQALQLLQRLAVSAVQQHVHIFWLTPKPEGVDVCWLRLSCDESIDSVFSKTGTAACTTSPATCATVSACAEEALGDSLLPLTLSLMSLSLPLPPPQLLLASLLLLLPPSLLLPPGAALCCSMQRYSCRDAMQHSATSCCSCSSHAWSAAQASSSGTTSR